MRRKECEDREKGKARDYLRGTDALLHALENDPTHTHTHTRHTRARARTLHSIVYLENKGNNPLFIIHSSYTRWLARNVSHRRRGIRIRHVITALAPDRTDVRIRRAERDRGSLRLTAANRLTDLNANVATNQDAPLHFAARHRGATQTFLSVGNAGPSNAPRYSIIESGSI